MLIYYFLNREGNSERNKMNNNSNPSGIGNIALKQQKPFCGKQLIVGIVSIYCLSITSLFSTAQNKVQSVYTSRTNTSSILSSSIPVKNNYASIGDYAWIDNNNNGLQDAGEQGVPNIMVVLYDSLLNTIDTKYTDHKGHYIFDSIKLPASGEKSFCVGFYNVQPNFAYANLVKDSSAGEINSKLDPITGRTKLFTLHAGDSRMDIDGGIKSAPGIVLPLTIDQFRGVYSNGFILLKWTTFTEINIDHFEVERSADGVEFRQLGRVESIGLTNNNNSYSFNDITAAGGSNFYRLVMIDNQGNYTYSKSIMVSIDVKGISVSVVYPNPFSKRVVVRISSDKDKEQVIIRIINSEGTVVRTQPAEVYRGDNNITVKDVNELPGGLYYLEVLAENRSMKTKLMKQ